MPVDEDINLDSPDGITEEDIQKMEAIANDLEILAKNAEKAKERIEGAAKPLEGMNFAQLEIIQKGLKGGEGDKGSLEDNNTGALNVKELQNMIIKIIKELEEEKKKNKEQEKDIDEMKERIKEVKSHFGEFSNVKNEIISFGNNPTGFAKNKALQFLGKAGLYGVIAQFVISQIESLYGTIIDEIKSWYRDGGPLDTRKLMEDQLKEFNEMNYALKINRGQVFYTADVNRGLYQGVPRGADNTRDKVSDNIIYMQKHLGE